MIEYWRLERAALLQRLDGTESHSAIALKTEQKASAAPNTISPELT
jgi:hypothetical protein